MSFKDAAIEILGRINKPLTAKEIIDIAFQDGLIETAGKTPEASMGAILYVDIKDNEESPFIKVGRGKFGLKSQDNLLSSPLEFIDHHNRNVRKAFREKLLEMDPYQFEILIGSLLQEIGFENVTVTKQSRDGGIDIKADLTVGGITNVKTAVQVKRYKSNIPGKIIAQLRGSAEMDQRGLVITTSDFTKDAILEAKASNKMPVSLVNGEKLIDLLLKYGVGIRKEVKTIYEVDTDYFGNEPDLRENELEASKYKSIWPLPGGAYKYVDTLNRFLEAIMQGTTKKEDLIEWYLKQFPNVNSRKTAVGSIYVPQNMGLTGFKDGEYFLTDEGKQYLQSKDLDFLYGVIAKNVLALSDIYEFLKTSKEPKKEEEISDYIKNNFDVEWTTLVQVNFRLQWLVNLGKVKKEAEGFVAVF